VGGSDNLLFFNLLFLDGSSVFKFTPAGVFSVVAGVGSPTCCEVYGESFVAARGLAADSKGNIYLADNVNLTVRKFDSSGNVVALIGSGILGDADGNANTAKFCHPMFVAVDDAGGIIYVREPTSYRLRKITVE
jgi:serine/threonine-protein kinase